MPELTEIRYSPPQDGTTCTECGGTEWVELLTSAGPCKKCCPAARHVAAGERPTAEPVPGRLYQVRRGDSLLGITRRAYGTTGGTNLRASKRLNTANAAVHRPPRREYSKRHYPGGIVSFYEPFPVIRVPEAAA